MLLKSLASKTARLRITVFARRLASYSVRFFRELAARGHALELIYTPAADAAPYAEFNLGFCAIAVADGDGDYRRQWLQQPDANLPDAALIVGWTEASERRAGRRLRRLGRPVVCGIDNPWRGTLRQRVGMLIAPWYLQPMANIAWVPGAPQVALARRLGFARVEQGYYCADFERFACTTPLASRQPALLFTGRLVTDKGVDLLVAAYRAYRQAVREPLALRVAGTGPLAPLLRGVPGIEALGFVQPAELPALMARCQALVLPSRVENWGVVIHEAAAASLPVLASAQCHATSRFVRDGDSGLVFAPTASALRDALLRFHHQDAAARQAMSQASHTLALTWRPLGQVELFEHLISSTAAS